MKARIRTGEHLKRLIRRYGDLREDMGIYKSEGTDIQEEANLHAKMLRARKALYDEIDRLTSIDLTPRPVQEMT